jgi:two-component system sensor histidine kinase FlrB
LETAFNLFNQLSAELTGSYRELQLQVIELSRELAAARTERMLQLAEKERLAERLARVLETLPAAVILLDQDGCVQEFNPAAEIHLVEGELGGAAFEMVFSPVAEPSAMAGGETAVETAIPFTIEQARSLS